MKDIKTVFKFWIETEDGYIFGEGPFDLLCKIREVKTLSAAAESLGMSYRHAWGIIREIEERVGAPLIKTRKGGARGGGGTTLTEDGNFLVNEYYRLKEMYSIASRTLGRKGIDHALGLEGCFRGRIVKMGEGKPTIIEVDIEKGETVKLMLDEKQVKEKGIILGDRLRLGLKDVSLLLYKE
ncbi:LysR family transcriptional regulator [Candidatus Bathyarchaeota archaeon]|nr:LysR family transcriptional regulator [Candidatus Bathyarchaeota archaeon]